MAGTNGPVGEFCAALGDLQRTSGLTRATLARELNYGRSQLYEILDGRIKRPPEWDRLVEPLVRACLDPGLSDARREAAVADWRYRHAVLVRVHDELARRDLLAAAPPPRAGSSRSLVTRSAARWRDLVAHPFVGAVADGTIEDATFRRWMVNDHYYNSEYQRFVAALAGIAPATATEAIASAASGNRTGLDQIRRLSARFVIDLDREPALATVGLVSYLQAQVLHGYEPALTALYAAEKVYFDVWSSIRSRVDREAPYWELVDHFSSEQYGHWLGGLARLVDAATPGGPSPEAYQVFDRVVRFELLFFDAMLSGRGW